ncbi:MAG: matrixin family metalloprotease [Isosphaeraceae bacterium]|nr:matrixin family metalloprotease [Isosphaeraceae bacterium]
MPYVRMARVWPRRDASRVRASRIQSQPSLERLEERQLLSATNGGAWAYPVRVTYSLVPDGTSIGGTPSSLFSTMNGYASTATWEAAIAKAAASWENAAGINLVQVADDGSPIGSGNDEQGAPNFGDIRFGAMPEPSGELAFAFLPPPKNGSSAAADIFFNANVNWGSNGYDLATVALHEIGHALGLAHSTASSAVMYANYNSVKQSLTADDTSGIQSVYGARTTGTNINASHATPVTLNSGGTATVTGVQVAAATDQNWYSVVIPQNTNGSLTVILQSSNLSSLEPRLTLYNSGLQGLAQASTTTFGGTATVTLNGVSAGQTYYLRVTANTSGAGSAGAYGLEVASGTGTPSPTVPPDTTVAAQANQGGATSAETTGSGTTAGGGLLGGLTNLVANVAGGVVGTLASLLDGAEHLIQVGTLTNWAEAYSAGPGARHRGPGHPHPHGAGPKPHSVSVVTRTIA